MIEKGYKNLAKIVSRDGLQQEVASLLGIPQKELISILNGTNESDFTWEQGMLLSMYLGLSLNEICDFEQI